MRLHITAEGQTEQSFINRTLKVYLAQYGVYADVRCVLTGRKRNSEFRGGMTSYEKAKNDIVRWLREEKKNTEVAFTTMFDFYALPQDFPGFELAKKEVNPYDGIAIIERAFADDICDNRFIPYIQLHEFETLLFTDPQKFELEYFDYPQKIQQLKKIREEFMNPELINHGENTSPSKRIIKVFPSYKGNKPAIGSMVAHEIGIEELKKVCTHFGNWVTQLEKL